MRRSPGWLLDEADAEGVNSREGTPNSKRFLETSWDPMAYLIEVPLDGAHPIVMEIDDVGDGGIIRSARPGEVIGTAATSFDAALERLQPMAQALVARLRDLAEGPDGIGVEFGLKMSMDAGLVVAHTSGEANFKVTLQWNRA
jgi:hypothetical protein